MNCDIFIDDLPEILENIYFPDRCQNRPTTLVAFIIPSPTRLQFDLNPLVFVELLVCRAVSVIDWVQPNPLASFRDTGGTDEFLICS